MIGRRRIRRPVAWKTALPIAAATPHRPTSPTPLTPTGLSRSGPPTNFLAFVLGGFSYYDPSACIQAPDGSVTGGCESTLSAVDGGVVLAVLVVVSVALSVWATHRRDVP